MTQISVTREKNWIVEPERILAAFLIFSLFYFSYLYFFSFDEGVSSAPAWLKGVKDAVYALVLIALVPSHSFTRDWREWIFAPLVIALITTSLIHAPQTGLKDQLWQNIKNVAIFVPIYHAIFWLRPEQRDWLTKQIFSILIFAAVVQCLFSFVFDWSGGGLWSGRVYSGLIGNPNSFSLVLNLTLCVILAFTPTMNRKFFAASLLVVGFIYATILHTFSGSQFAIFIFLVVYGAIIMRTKWLRFIAIALVAITVSLAQKAQIDSTLFIFSGIPDAIQWSQETDVAAHQKLENVSGSVTVRLEVIRLAVSVFENPADALLGSFSAKQYTPMDGQFFVFLYNGGLLLLFAFAIPAAVVYILSLASVWRSRDVPSAALHFMITAFGITFAASRVLMYYPLNFFFFMLCGLLITAIRQSHQAKCRMLRLS